MKTAVYFAIVSISISTSAYSQSTCTAGGNPSLGPVAPCDSGGINIVDPSVQQASAAGIRPTATQSRITVIDAGSPFKSPVNNKKLPASTPGITVITDDPSPAKTADSATKAQSKNEEPSGDAAGPAPTEEETAIREALKGLIGSWKAPARLGDGELTTIELRVDGRGRVELTLPDANGKPSTIKRRLELNGKELKLTGSDSEMLLGQLQEVNSRQMVLNTGGGQVTFVRP
jgi:hypothetical protein